MRGLMEILEDVTAAKTETQRDLLAAEFHAFFAADHAMRQDVLASREPSPDQSTVGIRITWVCQRCANVGITRQIEFARHAACAVHLTPPHEWTNERGAVVCGSCAGAVPDATGGAR
jgi:hypothetical protein